MTADEADEKCPKFDPMGIAAELPVAGVYIGAGPPSGPLLALPESDLNKGPLCIGGGCGSDGWCPAPGIW